MNRARKNKSASQFTGSEFNMQNGATMDSTNRTAPRRNSNKLENGLNLREKASQSPSKMILGRAFRDKLLFTMNNDSRV